MEIVYFFDGRFFAKLRQKEESKDLFITIASNSNFYFPVGRVVHKEYINKSLYDNKYDLIKYIFKVAKVSKK